MPRRALWWLVACVLALGVAAHFTLLILAALPTALVPELRTTAMTYTAPLFRQSWSFFAPEPPLFSHSVYVRGALEQHEASELSPWLPLTEPLIRAVQQQRFSPQEGPLSGLLYGAYDLAEPGITVLADPIRQRLLERLTSVDRKPASLIALERMGSSALAQAYPATTIRAVQVRITLKRLPGAPAALASEESIDLVFPAGDFEPANQWSPAW